MKKYKPNPGQTRSGVWTLAAHACLGKWAGFDSTGCGSPNRATDAESSPRDWAAQNDFSPWSHAWLGWLVLPERGSSTSCLPTPPWPLPVCTQAWEEARASISPSPPKYKAHQPSPLTWWYSFSKSICASGNSLSSEKRQSKMLPLPPDSQVTFCWEVYSGFKDDCN